MKTIEEFKAKYTWAKGMAIADLAAFMGFFMLMHLNQALKQNDDMEQFLTDLKDAVVGERKNG